ncbi:unnamed protein product [Caenorhabditis brenneri]
MNRSWQEVFLENCGPDRLKFLSSCSAAALLPLSTLYVTSIWSFFKKRKIFHPLFSFCFIVLLTLYFFSSTFLALRNVTFSMYGYNYDKMDSLANTIIAYSERFYMAINFFIPPIIAIGIIERLIATTLSQSYEKSRPWMLLGFGLVIASVLVYIEFSYRHDFNSTISTRIQVLFAILCSFSLLLLLSANISKSKKGKANSALSERYQVNENLKALKIQIPIVCIDTGIQIMFLCSDVSLNVGQVLDLNKCYDDELYLNKFGAFRLIGFTFQYFIPLIVLVHFSPFCCYAIRRGPSKRQCGVSPSQEAPNGTSVITIRNAFGVPISGVEFGRAGQDAHFKNLHAQWN